jgi:phosphoribosylformimino-5-aminoimidazole carboxamide ribonucleotide (ProFAR) isomerase
MAHTPETAAAQIAIIKGHREESGRADLPFEVTVGGACDSAEAVAAWQSAGVDRLIVSPWRRSREALDAMEVFAGQFMADQ